MILSYSKIKQQQLYFLHINKTGGTYVEDVVPKRKNLVRILGHHSSVLNISEEGFFFFTLRNPFDRICSSDFKLFRKPDKFKKLKSFNNADEYIECLCHPESEKHQLAIDIHNTHPHLSKSYWNFFISEEYFHACSSRIMVAIKTERLTDDLPRFLLDLYIKIDKDAVFDKTNWLNRSSSIENYVEYFGKDSYDNYARNNPLEFKFYNSALKFTKFDNRYEMTLDRYIGRL